MSDQEKEIRLQYLGNMLWYLGDTNAALIDEIKQLWEQWETDPQEELIYQKSLQLMEGMNRFNTFYLEYKELMNSLQNDPSQP